MSIDRGMDKQDVVQIYSEAIKENEIMSFPGMWMDLEIIINEESQRLCNVVRRDLNEILPTECIRLSVYTVLVCLFPF